MGVSPGTVRGGLIILLLSVGLNGMLVWTLHRQPGEPIELTEPTPAPTVTPAPIVVYVSGAVERPGVYELPAESRVVDVIEAAGGFTTDAAVAAINQAAPVRDGMQVHVAAEGEAASPTSIDVVTPEEPSNGSGDLININTAGAPQLEELPGIGPTLAERIIEYRESSGPFSSIDALLEVKGIGDETLQEIRPHVTVGP